jgi:hypothetical protein
VVNILTDADIAAVSDREKLLKVLSWARLEAGHGARIVVDVVDDGEEDQLVCRYCARPGRVKAVGSG